MSGKQHKRELRRQREAARATARREERQRTIITIIVIAVVVAIGGVLVFFSLKPVAPQTQTEKNPSSALVRSEAPIACEATEPPNTGAAREYFPTAPPRCWRPDRTTAL